jgi:chemotaxis protein CheC
LAKLLIVDDSATSRAIAIKLIGGDHSFVEADSGQAALDLLGAEDFDLVLLDLLMPGMGGFEVLSELAARGCAVPVVVATADIQYSTRARAGSLGAVALLNKPLRKESLDAAVASALSDSSRSAIPPLEPLLKDGFEELMNIAIGKAAEVLNTMLSSPIALSIPSVQIVSIRSLEEKFSRPGQGSGSGKLAAVEMRCAGGLDASIELILTSEDAIRLADCVLGTAGSGLMEREDLRSGALCEIGNIVINAVLGTVANILEVELNFSVPSYLEGGAAALVGEIARSRQGIILMVETRFEVRDLSIDGDIALFLSLDSFDSLTGKMRDRLGARR